MKREKGCQEKILRDTAQPRSSLAIAAYGPFA